MLRVPTFLFGVISLVIVGTISDVLADGGATPNSVTSTAVTPESTFSLGLLAGATQIIGLTAEGRWGSNAVGLNAGWVSGGGSVALFGKRYIEFTPWPVVPFAGLGFWGAYIPTSGGRSYGITIHAPLGFDWRMHEQWHLALEVDLSMNAYFRDYTRHGEVQSGYWGGFLALPGISVKYAF